MGYLHGIQGEPSTAYMAAVEEALAFVSKVWGDGMASPSSVQLLYPFGSYPLGRVATTGDVDVVALCPQSLTCMAAAEQLAQQLQAVGVSNVHVAHSSRCPRLCVELAAAKAPPVQLDLIFLRVPTSVLAPPSRGTAAATPAAAAQMRCLSVEQLVACVEAGDGASRIAMEGLRFSKLVSSRVALLGDAVPGRHMPSSGAPAMVSPAFVGAIDALVALLQARRLKGNAFHAIRTFHLVSHLSAFVQQLSEHQVRSALQRKRVAQLLGLALTGCGAH